MFKRNTFVYLALMAAMVGCGKKFLQRDPQALVLEDKFYKTSQELESAINAAYDPLGWETDKAGASYPLPGYFGDIVSDDAVKGGSDDSDQSNWGLIETFTANPSLREFQLVYQRLYTGILRANLVIKNASNSTAGSTITNRFVGEAKFLRGYYHFELVKHFGEVPLLDRVLGPEEYAQPKASKAALFAQIEADFKDAAALLPEKGSIEAGRATKGAAIALLARAQMYQTLNNKAKWSEVLDNCKKVIDSKVYDLEPKFEMVCSTATENGKESIFEIQHGVNIAGLGGDNGSTWTRGNEGTVMNTMTRGRANSGWGFNCPTLDLLNDMSGDPRKKETIVQNGDAVFGDIYKLDITKYPFTATATRKYIEPTDAAKINVSDGPSNPRIMRYADVLLMAAEAANELGQDTSVVNLYLNKVRLRAGLPKNNINGQEAVKQAIWHERRVELAMEGHRFFDLVRQGRAAEVMQKTLEGSRFRKGVNEVFPIPQSEIDASKGKLIQNPGY